MTNLHSNRYNEWLSRPRIVAGLMTGTSVDAVDIAICEFNAVAIDVSNDDTAETQSTITTKHTKTKHTLKILAYSDFDIPKNTRELIVNSFCLKTGIREISLINFLLPRLYSDAIQKVCSGSGISLESIEAVGVHGQTLWHDPKGELIDGHVVLSTFQAGSVSVLSKILNKTVVGDFRSADMAFGGEGAPLVPIFDYEFLRHNDEDIIALNIGGMANLTYLKAGCKVNDVLAFDTGCGNVLMDLASQLYFGKHYDHDGLFAAKGEVLPHLLDELKNTPFVYRKPPKSTGRELFSTAFLNEKLNLAGVRQCRSEDIIATITFFTAWSIAENIRLFANPEAKLIVSGGGTRNPELMKALKNQLPHSQVISSDEVGLPSDAKESICFAYLAYRTLGGLPSNLPSVTGASKETVLGVISNP